MSSNPEIVVSFGDRGDSTCVDIGVLPGLELRDEQVQEATDQLYAFLRSAFHLPYNSRLTLHETETGRILSNETFRDPSFITKFPKYWYLTAENGYNATTIAPAFQSLSVEDPLFPSTDYSELSDLLLMEGYSPTELNQVGYGEEEEEELGGMYPSLMELSMGQSPSLELESSREDLTTLSFMCDEDGDFGAVFRHFTVVANVLNSDQSGSEADSRSDSSAHSSSSDSMFDTIRMSTLFVSSVIPGGAADIAGLQTGDIVYSVNGQSVTVSTTEELATIIEESSKKIVLWVSPEKHDDLLFLYPRYVNEEPGEYSLGSNEKIFISDIVVRTQNLLSPTTDDRENSLTDTPLSNSHKKSSRTNKRVRPSSADFNSYSRITSARDPVNNFHNLDVHSPLGGGSSEQSLSSDIEYNSSIEDLLIQGSLADIPVQPSPVQQRKFKRGDPLIERVSSAGLPHKLHSNGLDPDSQDWLLDENKGGPTEWFPKADDDRHLTLSMPVHNGSSSNEIMSQSGEFPSAFGDPHSSSAVAKKTKLTHRLKKTLKNLAGSSSSSGGAKLEKTNSLGTKTNSTSAIDQLKINGTDLSKRSTSTDLGKIKLKRASLEALTKVNSEESIVRGSRGRNSALRKQRSCEDQPNTNVHQQMLNLETQIIPTLDFIATSPNLKETVLGTGMFQSSAILSNHSQGSVQYQLTPELGKNLSGESVSSSMGLRSGRTGGRSYRTQRQRLHQTKNPKTAGDSDKDVFTSSLITTLPSSSKSENITPTRARRYSKDMGEYSSPSLPKKSPARRTSSWQNRNNGMKPGSEHFSSQDKAYNFSFEESLEVPAITSSLQSEQHHLHVQAHRDRQPVAARVPHVPLMRSRSANETSQGSGEDRDDMTADERHTYTSSIDPSLSHCHQRPHSSGGKMSSRKAMSVHPNLVQSNSLSCDTNNRGYDNTNRPLHVHVHEHRTRKLPNNQQPVKINSVFHGPIHKKQEKDVGGKKSTDRSWRPLYAAIQKHWMVFYNNIQDALVNNPLVTEPPLDLHQCAVKVLPNGYKNKKNVIRLTLQVDNSECLIQSDNEESMMTWMRIIHNLSRMRMRMGPQLLHVGAVPHRSSTSTQEDLPKSQPKEKRRIQRLYTPQPPSKKKQPPEKDDPSRRQQLLEMLKRGKKRKDAVEDVDVPCYNTFGKPIEDCPASYKNKNIPLIVMVCINELEENWMDTEGLYRIAGPIGQVRNLAQDVNKGHFSLLQGHNDPHVITAVLKKFLKELPDPLVPLDMYRDFISCVQNHEGDERAVVMKGLVEELPPLHYHTLGFLIKHLTNIAAQKEVTKMNQHNLCIVFGPTVVHKEGDDVVVTEMNATIMTIKILMDNLEDFFSKVDFSAIQNNNEQTTSSSSDLLKLNSRTPFTRGKSDPCNSQAEYYGARSQSPRKSWDGTAMSSVNRSLLTVGSQDMFSLTGDFGNSQDRRGPHKRRLTTSRGKLNYIDEPQKDLPSPTHSSTTPSPVTPSSASASVVSPKRKISYTAAVSKAWDSPSTDVLQSVDEDRVDSSHYARNNYPFEHQSMTYLNDSPERKSSAGVYSASQRPSRHSVNHTDVHHKRRWSALEPAPRTEIIGPTSTDNDWMKRGFTSSVNRTIKQHTYVRGPESCL